MNKYLSQFLLFLSVIILVVFGLHLLVLNTNKLSLFDHKIITSYVLNIVLAVSIYLFLYLNRIKYKAELGFLYMAGSFLKLLFFGLFLYPSYHKDGSVSKLEFFTFFIPYVTCLVIETYFLIKLLNSRELNQ